MKKKEAGAKSQPATTDPHANLRQARTRNFHQKIDDFHLDSSRGLLLSILRKHRTHDCLDADTNRPFLVRETPLGTDVRPIHCDRLDCASCAPKIIAHYRARLTEAITGHGLLNCYTFTLPPSYKFRDTYQRMQKSLRYFREWYKRTTGSTLTFIRVFGLSDNSMDVHLVTNTPIPEDVLESHWKRWSHGRKVDVVRNTQTDVPVLVQYMLINYAQSRLGIYRGLHLLRIKRAINASRNIDIRYKMPSAGESGFKINRGSYREFMAREMGVSPEHVPLLRRAVTISKKGAERSDATRPADAVNGRRGGNAAGGGVTGARGPSWPSDGPTPAEPGSEPEVSS